ncbi:hypothetical protein [Xenorhabdus sp. TH1]|uniref:hypothetical protein n=1 Tax=Xenorhabdus sp. TH1 TaxID=3130166 RepID=UPI0030D45759
MRHIKAWAASEHTKLFNTLKEPLFVEKIARYTGRGINEIYEKLIQVGLCSQNVKDNTLFANRYTSVSYFTANGCTAFIATLGSLGWESVLHHGEERLKAPAWWLEKGYFPHEITGVLGKNKTIWINEEIYSVINMMKNFGSISGIANKFNRESHDVLLLLVDLGIVETQGEHILYLPRVNDVKLSKYMFNDALTLINNGWRVVNAHLNAPEWWTNLNRKPETGSNAAQKARLPLHPDKKKALYRYVHHEFERAISVLKASQSLQDLTALSSDNRLTYLEIAEYVGLVNRTGEGYQKQTVTEMTLFFDKPKNTKKGLIKHGWKVEGHHLIAPIWWTE